MGNFIDMAGRQFGRLKVVDVDRKVGRGATCERGTFWRCRCACGNEKIVNGTKLRTGNTRSCGCLIREMRPKLRRKHGEANKTAEYKAWRNMKNSRLGITVCERWRDSFECFLADMGRKPSPAHVLHRWPNKDGNFDPTNCRWATRKEQANNRRPRSQFPPRNIFGQWASP